MGERERHIQAVVVAPRGKSTLVNAARSSHVKHSQRAKKGGQIVACGKATLLNIDFPSCLSFTQRKPRTVELSLPVPM